jgi:hypothetical protein
MYRTPPEISTPPLPVHRLSDRAQAGMHNYAARGLDLYCTPAAATWALLQAEKSMPAGIWEPASGVNSITNILRSTGHQVVASDIADYGAPLNLVADFFDCNVMVAGCTGIISNPPYQCATEFARHALKLAPWVCLLARLCFLEGKGRSDLLEHRGLVRVHIFRNRLEMMHRSTWNGPHATSSIAFAWFVWSRDHRGDAVINCISWQPTNNHSDGVLQRFRRTNTPHSASLKNANRRRST